MRGWSDLKHRPNHTSVKGLRDMADDVIPPRAESCKRSAVISTCGRYRYRLDRPGVGDWSTLVIMVNPSIADATFDDPTIRKLLGFAKRNGWGRLIVGNLFAYRSTDVRSLGQTGDPVGQDNDNYLIQMLSECDQVVCAWGPIAKQPAWVRGRYLRVLELIDGAGLDPLHIADLTKCGHPKHPLMLPYDSPVRVWEYRPRG